MYDAMAMAELRREIHEGLFNLTNQLKRIADVLEKMCPDYTDENGEVYPFHIQQG